MKNIVINSISVILVVLFAGCATSGYKAFYKQTPTNKQLIEAKSNPDIKFLQKNEEPKVYSTNNFDKDTKKLRSQGYLVLGASSFNGAYEDESYVIAQAKRIGATLILINSKYTNTETRTSTMLLPDNKTTYSSGNVNTNATYNSNNGSSGYGNANTNYSGTSTTYGTKAVPYTTNTRRYDQSAMFFILNTKKPKFGIQVIDIPREKRIRLDINGVIVNAISEDTPAYNSNVLEGDIILKMNNIKITNVKQISKLMKNHDTSNDCIWTILRDGKEKEVTISFD